MPSRISPLQPVALAIAVLMVATHGAPAHDVKINAIGPKSEPVTVNLYHLTPSQRIVFMNNRELPALTTSEYIHFSEIPKSVKMKCSDKGADWLAADPVAVSYVKDADAMLRPCVGPEAVFKFDYQIGIVLFDAGSVMPEKSYLAIIDDYASVASHAKALSISVTGYADRSGPEDYNMALSLRRADFVREALIAGGISPDAITVAGRGESEPAVPTADGVKEQANRRVEIVLE